MGEFTFAAHQFCVSLANHILAHPQVPVNANAKVYIILVSHFPHAYPDNVDAENQHLYDFSFLIFLFS